MSCFEFLVRLSLTDRMLRGGPPFMGSMPNGGMMAQPTGFY